MRNPKILILESERLLGSLMASAVQCRYANCEVSVATCEATGLEKVIHDGYDTILISESLLLRLDQDVLNELKSLFPKLAFVMICKQINVGQVRKYHQMGITSYVTYSNTIEQIFEALIKAINGDFFLAPQPNVNRKKDGPGDDLGHAQPINIHLLSKRELEIFRMLGRGLSIQDIAQQLRISSKTVTVHKCKIGKKTGLNSSQKVIRYHYENNTRELSRTES